MATEHRDAETKKIHSRRAPAMCLSAGAIWFDMGSFQHLKEWKTLADASVYFPPTDGESGRPLARPR